MNSHWVLNFNNVLLMGQNEISYRFDIVFLHFVCDKHVVKNMKHFIESIFRNSSAFVWMTQYFFNVNVSWLTQQVWNESNLMVLTLRLRAWPSGSKHLRPECLWQLLQHQMRLSRRKAGYLTQILLWQQNLQHGHDRHSQNGWFHDEGETDIWSMEPSPDAASTLQDLCWVFNPAAVLSFYMIPISRPVGGHSSDVRNDTSHPNMSMYSRAFLEWHVEFD